MIPAWQAALLGAVQGLTEFLPISSSAHLVLLPWLFEPYGWQEPQNELAFDVALHAGTLLAVVILFFFDYLLICASYIGDLRQKRWLGGQRGSLLPKIIIGTIPAAIVGKVFESRVENFFYEHESNLWMVGISLAVFGLLLLLSERIGKQNREMNEITYGNVAIIGICQAFAIMPGVSRSGVTIFAALLLGLTRPAAARFSFLLATPIIGGATLLQATRLSPSDYNFSLFIGVLTSAVVGIVAIKFLLRYVQTRSFLPFVVYRWILAAIVLAVFFTRQQ